MQSYKNSHTQVTQQPIEAASGLAAVNELQVLSCSRCKRPTKNLRLLTIQLTPAAPVVVTLRCPACEKRKYQPPRECVICESPILRDSDNICWDCSKMESAGRPAQMAAMSERDRFRPQARA